MFSRTFLGLQCRASAKSTFTAHSTSSHRSLHLASRNLRRDLGIRLVRCHESHTPILGAAFVRHISLSTTKFQNVSTPSPPESNVPEVTDSTNVDLLSQIPEAPSPIVTEVIEAIQTVGEPTFKSLGLGSWYPPGMVQQLLEMLHINVGLPWWATIAASTVCIRLLIFPITVRIQRYSARMNNIQPEMQYIQLQLADARKMGDHMEVMRLTQELYSFMVDKNVDPKKNAWLPMVQAPIFISFYYALRGMVNVPVESMKEGGLWWFTDLTVPDPYCILPLLTSTTLFITLEMGTDTLKIANMGMLRYVFRAIPVIMFPFIMKFEGAILCYWVSTNLFSLIQVSILRSKKVRSYFEIPELIKHDIKKLPNSKKKFVEGFKDSWTNLKVARELNSREMYDETVFRNAGKGPVPKTYKYDPTKPHPLATAILSKKKA